MLNKKDCLAKNFKHYLVVGEIALVETSLYLSPSDLGSFDVRLRQAAVVLLVPARRHQDRLEVVGRGEASQQTVVH
jgi:hypothetical protein